MSRGVISRLLCLQAARSTSAASEEQVQLIAEETVLPTWQCICALHIGAHLTLTPANTGDLVWVWFLFDRSRAGPAPESRQPSPLPKACLLVAGSTAPRADCHC